MHNERNGPTDRSRGGFSIIELMFVLLIGSILMSMAFKGASGYLARQGAINARDAFVYLSSRARASAIERGGIVRLELDPAGERVWLVTGRSGAGDTLEVLNYSGEYQADVQTGSGSALTICYTARGFADETCTSIAVALDLRFVRGADTARALVRPLGQVEVR